MMQDQQGGHLLLSCRGEWAATPGFIRLDSFPRSWSLRQPPPTSEHRVGCVIGHARTGANPSIVGRSEILSCSTLSNQTPPLYNPTSLAVSNNATFVEKFYCAIVYFSDDPMDMAHHDADHVLHALDMSLRLVISKPSIIVFFYQFTFGMLWHSLRGVICYLQMPSIHLEPMCC